MANIVVKVWWPPQAPSSAAGTIILFHKLHHRRDILVGAGSIGKTTPPSPQLTL
jgi:hypothetical protein